MHTPPKGFGLVWTEVGPKNTINGRRILFTAPRTARFDRIWQKGGRHRLYGAGFGEGLDGAVAFWMPETYDSLKARTLVAMAVLEAFNHRRFLAAERVRIEKRASERAAERERKARAKAEDIARRCKFVVDGCRRILAHRRWAIHERYLEEVERFAGMIEVDPVDLRRAEQIVRRTDLTVDNAQASLDEEPPADDFAFCQDPEVRTLVARAVGLITGNDADWAEVRNDIGWSKAHTVRGHVLALAESSISAKHAAHAMGLLRYHHKQVPEDIRGPLKIA